MGEEPLLTVIMPVYNVEQYLPKALESVLAQTFKDWDLIAVDDGSTDRSGEILDAYAARDSRIKSIHQLNGGSTSARKKALKLSRGKYVTFLDSDDWVEPFFLDKMVHFVQDNDLDVAIGSGVEECNGQIRHPYRKNNQLIYTHDQALVELLSHRHHGWGLCSCVYKREMLDEYNLSSHIVCGEDLMTNWLIYKKANRIGYLPVDGYHYVKRNDSLTTSNYSWKKYTIMEVLEEIGKERNAMTLEVRQAFDSAWRARALGAMTGMILSGKEEYNVEFLKLQAEIRADLLGCLTDKYFSVARKILACYFSLPISLCRTGRPILAWGQSLLKGK